MDKALVQELISLVEQAQEHRETLKKNLLKVLELLSKLLDKPTLELGEIYDDVGRPIAHLAYVQDENVIRQYMFKDSGVAIREDSSIYYLTSYNVVSVWHRVSQLVYKYISYYEQFKEMSNEVTNILEVLNEKVKGGVK